MYEILLKLFQRYWSRNESCFHTPSIVLRNIAFRVALLIFIAKAKNRATTGIRSIDISNEFLVLPSPFPLRRVFDGTPSSRGEGRGAERPVAGSRNYGALLQLCRVTEFLQACEQPKRKSLVSPPSPLNCGRPILAFSSAFRGTSARFRIPGDRSQVRRILVAQNHWDLFPRKQTVSFLDFEIVLLLLS